MSYVNKVLQPGEQVRRIAHRHWIIYHKAIFFALLAIIVFALGYANDAYRFFAVIVGGVLSAVALVFFIRAWFRQAILEIAVTNKRIIYKIGFIKIHTAEMNLDKIETVVVDQSILGRLLDYGTVDIKGTGQTMEKLREIAAPIELRNAIETR
ncbi:MAG: PH domain-containing protein [Beijerinckiaceae bacterium]